MKVKPMTIIAILCVRYLILPMIGIGVVRAVSSFGWLPSDSLFQFVLMLQFSLPPAMNIGKELLFNYDMWTHGPSFLNLGNNRTRVQSHSRDKCVREV